MSESIQHRQLVEFLFVQALMLIDADTKDFICLDSLVSSTMPPQTDEGFRPDLFYCYQKKLIIGEAKTSKDFDTAHSRQQYESYIKKCSLFQGQAYFLIAVPWMETAATFNIIQRIRKEYPGNYIVKIHEGIGGFL